MTAVSSTVGPPSVTDWKTVLQASVVALLTLVLWWAGVIYLDGLLAEELPYHRYETVALLYPGVFYPGLPGWVLAGIQPFSLGVFVAAIGWMVVLSAAIGTATTWYATRRGLSPLSTAAASVIVLFITTTVVEATVVLFG